MHKDTVCVEHMASTSESALRLAVILQIIKVILVNSDPNKQLSRNVGWSL